MRQFLRNLSLIILGIGVGAVIVVLLHYFVFSGGRSGCPVEVNNSTENAQVFLMGTVGGGYSDRNRDCWREYEIMPLLDELGVTYYNPVVENWTPNHARIEARVIEQAETIVYVVTEGHPSIGSLAESGWATLSALERDQLVILFINPNSSDDESARAREIVLSQARTLAPELDDLVLTNSIEGVKRALRLHYRDRDS